LWAGRGLAGLPIEGAVVLLCGVNHVLRVVAAHTQLVTGGWELFCTGEGVLAR